MPKEILKIGEERLEIDTAQLTLLVPSANMLQKMAVEGYVTVDLDESMRHFSTIEALHPDLKKYLLLVFPDLLTHLVGEYGLASIKMCGSGVKHVVGRFDLTLKLRDLGIVKVFHQYPEAHLHPGVQANLADAFIELSM